MPATNKTTNYDLPIFIASDKPAWLTDWNGAMTAIDTAVASASQQGASADGKATTAQSTADTANATAKTALTTAQTAEATANEANSRSISNLTSISNIDKNLTFKRYMPIYGPNYQTGAIWIFASEIMGTIKGEFFTVTVSQITKTVIDTTTFIELFTLSGNPFNLVIGGLNKNTQICGSATLRYSKTAGVYLTEALSVYMYYDGAVSHVYTAVSNGFFNSLQDTSLYIWGNFPIFLTGQSVVEEVTPLVEKSVLTANTISFLANNPS